MNPEIYMLIVASVAFVQMVYFVIPWCIKLPYFKLTLVLANLFILLVSLKEYFVMMELLK
jgi:hypothetical protein